MMGSYFINSERTLLKQVKLMKTAFIFRYKTLIYIVLTNDNISPPYAMGHSLLNGAKFVQV